MTVYTLYKINTGDITGYLRCAPDQLSRHVPDGCSAILGKVDPRSKRIVHETGEIADSENISDHRMPIMQALRRIRQLETKKIRPMTDLILDPKNEAARARLHEIESEIENERLRVTSTVERPAS